MSGRRVILFCTLLVVAFATWQGCFVYDTSLLVPADGATETSSADASLTDADGCNHVRWPARPLADDDASVQDVTFYNAIENLDFGGGDASTPAALGFDLDGVCTCPGPGSCTPFGDSGAQCDYEGGVDNTLGTLVKEFSGTGFFDDAYVNGGLANGTFGLLFRLSAYNGQANDMQVVLSVFTSNGTTGVGTDAGAAPAKFDGTDVWTLEPAGLAQPPFDDAGAPQSALAYDLNAYVADYTLVANLSAMPLALGAGPGDPLIQLDLSNAVVVAKLSPFGASFKATGFVAGRWQTGKLLTAIQVLHDPFQVDAALCGDDAIYQLIRARICQSEDVPGNAANDRTSTPCDAVSLGFGFTSVPATFGYLYAAIGNGLGCGPQYSDKCWP